MRSKKHLNLTIDQNVVIWIDSLRGQVPRSTFINKILLKVSYGAKELFDWDLEEAKADEDIKKGRVQKFKSAKDAVKWLRQ